MAEKTAHTRRWKVLESDKPSPIYNGIVCMIAASPRVIAVVTEDGLPFDPDDWLAAASLIAAAPGMAAALQPTEDELDALVEIALHARVPGGSEVWVWLPQADAFTPHETAREVMRSALKAVMQGAAALSPATGTERKP